MVDKVRVYEVTTSGLVVDYEASDLRHKGDQVVSTEFSPPPPPDNLKAGQKAITAEMLEQSYVDSGALKLIYELTQEEWDKRQKQAKKDAKKK